MRDRMLSLAALPPRRAPQRPCRRDSLAFALLWLALAVRHACGEGEGRTRHPDDVAAAVRFRAPHVVAGCSTELDVTAIGLVQGVTYRLVVSVARAGDVVHVHETSIAWSREMAAANGDVHVFAHVLPPLSGHPHTVRATLQDVVAGVDGEAVLASMVQQLHLTEDLAAGATCAGQNLDVSSMHKLGLADDIKLAAGKAVGGEHPFRTDAAAASASRRKIHANFEEVEMSKPGIGRTRTNDNEHLDIGRTVAILLSGLTVPMTSTHVLPGIVENIIGPFGTNNVHVFVHTSPWNLTGQNDFSHTCHAL